MRPHHTWHRAAAGWSAAPTCSRKLAPTAASRWLRGRCDDRTRSRRLQLRRNATRRWPSASEVIASEPVLEPAGR